MEEEHAPAVNVTSNPSDDSTRPPHHVSGSAPSSSDLPVGAEEGSIEKALSSLDLKNREDGDTSDASVEQGEPRRMFRSLAIIFQRAKQEAPDLNLNVRGPSGIMLGAALRQGDDNEAQGIHDIVALATSIDFLRQMLSARSPSLEISAKVLADASRERQ
jgi:hypothetical protein